MKMKPFIVGFEGVDGSGKTTQVRLLEEKLKSLGYSVRNIKETEDTYLGKLASGMEDRRDNWQRYLTFLASKSELAEVLSHCSEDFVLLDRFTPSMFAYAPSKVVQDSALHYAVRRLLKLGIRFPKVHVCVLMRSSYGDYLLRRSIGNTLSEEEFSEIDRLYRRATHGCAVWKLEVNTSVTTVEKTHELIADYVLKQHRKGDESCQQ